MFLLFLLRKRKDKTQEKNIYNKKKNFAQKKVPKKPNKEEEYLQSF